MARGSFMRLGMCAGLDQLELVHAAGYDFAEINTFQLMLDQDDAAFAPVREKALAAATPIEACNCFVPGRLKVTGPEIDITAVRAHMDRALRRASELGVSIMVFGSGGARSAPEGFPVTQAQEQYLAAVRLAGEIAAQYGVTIVLEPLGTKECNIFNRVDQGAKMVDAVAHPNVKLLADSYHMRCGEEPFANMIAADTRLAHLHIDMPDVAAIKAGAASYFPEFIATAVDAGYSARISVENHSFQPAEGMQFTDYYVSVYDYLAALLPVRK